MQNKENERRKQRRTKGQTTSSQRGAASTPKSTSQEGRSKQHKPGRKYYLRREPADFTISFYERFDETFIYNQAVTLKYAIDQGEAFRSVLNVHLDQLGLGLVSERYFASLRAQFFFMVLHQCEALFALMRAPFSDVPDWIYLTAYWNEEIKDAISAFLRRDFGTFTNGGVKDMRTFLTWSIYAGISPTDEEARKEFDENLNQIEWYLMRLAQTYEENLNAYNSYKHGLRVMTGETWFRLRPNDAQGNPMGVGMSRTSPDSLIFLEFEKKPEDEATTVYETIVHFDPDESFFYLTILVVLLETIKNCRLARLKNEPPQGIRVFTEMNTTELVAKWSQRHFRLSMSQ